MVGCPVLFTDTDDVEVVVSVLEDLSPNLSDLCQNGMVHGQVEMKWPMTLEPGEAVPAEPACCTQ